jgi:outer membrane lipoprotein LolB
VHDAFGGLRYSAHGHSNLFVTFGHCYLSRLTACQRRGTRFTNAFQSRSICSEGTLNIYNPLGMQMARLEWTAQSARLLQGRQVRESASLERLVFELTGTQLPTAAVIDWLAGKPTPAEGWNVDVSEWHLRRLVLERVQPAPRTVLRIAFES